jgi:hypothetical protein
VWGAGACAGVCVCVCVCKECAAGGGVGGGGGRAWQAPVWVSPGIPCPNAGANARTPHCAQLTPLACQAAATQGASSRYAITPVPPPAPSAPAALCWPRDTTTSPAPSPLTQPAPPPLLPHPALVIAGVSVQAAVGVAAQGQVLRQDVQRLHKLAEQQAAVTWGEVEQAEGWRANGWMQGG